MTGSNDSIPVTVSFCLTGKAIAIGSNEGDLMVLDIATSEVLSAFRWHSNSLKSAIVEVKWVQHIDMLSASCSDCQLTGRLQCWLNGGVNLIDR